MVSGMERIAPIKRRKAAPKNQGEKDNQCKEEPNFSIHQTRFNNITYYEVNDNISRRNQHNTTNSKLYESQNQCWDSSYKRSYIRDIIKQKGYKPP